MSCINCQNKIQKALNMTDGVIKARAIIQAHGGAIRCESTPGVGSRFIVTFDKNE